MRLLLAERVSRTGSKVRHRDLGRRLWAGRANPGDRRLPFQDSDFFPLLHPRKHRAEVVAHLPDGSRLHDVDIVLHIACFVNLERLEIIPHSFPTSCSTWERCLRFAEDGAEN